jgi:peptidoglycan/LPS O-acetylase OafA/YrhL
MAQLVVAGAGSDQGPDGRDAGIRTLIAGDGLRGVAMLLVFASHLLLIADPAETGFETYGWAAPVLGHIDIGLSAFFVLSGYLIARPFARAYVLGTRRPGVVRFAENRLLRIAPAFYFFAVLILLRFGLDGTLGSGPDAPDAAGGPSSFLQVLGIFTFLQAQLGGPARAPIGQAWSIGAEIAFYVLVPLAAVLAYRLGARISTARRRALVALGLLALLELISIRLRAENRFLFAWLTSPPAILYAFLPGVAVAVAEPLFAPLLRDRARLARRLAWGAFALAALCLLVYVTSDYSDETTPIHHALGRRALLAATCTGALMFGLVALQLGTSRAPWLFANRAALWMGARSYSFYLVHIWVLLEIGHILGEGHGVATTLTVMLVVGLPVSMAAAALSYRYVERPFLERKRPTGGGRNAGAAPGPAPAPAPSAVGAVA